MFIDKIKITICSGKGGNGCVSFNKTLYKPYGGPDGGDGGNGGNIIVELDKNLNSLSNYRNKKKYIAENGHDGYKNKCHGANGSNTILKVPPGTIIINAISKKIITDITYKNKRQILLKGGKGGKGNIHYKTSIIQSPKYAQLGQQVHEIEIIFELKLIVDIGIIGLSNVGKSTLLTKVTNAKPKISDYYFTTINPCLGIINLKNCKKFTVVEIPGLLGGIKSNIKFGKKFLKHIERARILIHLICIKFVNTIIDVIDNICKINNELINYNIKFVNYFQIIVINKIDNNYKNYENLIHNIRYFYNYKIKVFVISLTNNSGINKLFYYINYLLYKSNKNK